MLRSQENKCNYKNCFGFNEGDADLSVWDKSYVTNDPKAPIEFQENKPYRLALYVKPSELKRRERAKAAVESVKTTTEKQTRQKKTETVSKTETSEKKTTRKRTTRGTKKVDVSLFDENVQPEEVSKVSKRRKKTPEGEKTETDTTNTTTKVKSTRKNVLKEVNTKCAPNQTKVKRSYVKKSRAVKEETENVTQPPLEEAENVTKSTSEESAKESEDEKSSETKENKTRENEDEEFEKWANSINSVFDEIDKFELSVTYD